MELLQDPIRAVTTDFYNTLLTLSIDTQVVERNTLQSTWVAELQGHVDELLVVRLHTKDPNAEPWFDLAAIYPTVGGLPKARLSIEGEEVYWNGPDAIWPLLTRFHAARRVSSGTEALVRLLGEPGVVEVTELSEVVTAQDSEFRIHVEDMRESGIALGRARVGTELTLYDPNTPTQIARVPLPKPIGTYARPRYVARRSELWVASGGLLVRVSVARKAVDGVLDVGGTRDSSIADFGFDSNQEMCAVTFDRVGAVLSVDVDSFEEVAVVETAESLDQIALLDDGRFVARATDGPRFVVSSF